MPVYFARSTAEVRVVELLPLIVWGAKVFPLAPPKSIVPSNALASKVWSAERAMAKPGTLGPDNVRSPVIVAWMVAGDMSRFSALIVFLIASEWRISTDIKVPRDGSNCGTDCEAVQFVRVSENAIVCSWVAGLALMRGSLVKL